LDERLAAEHRADGLVQRFAAIDHEQNAVLGGQATIAKSSDF